MTTRFAQVVGTLIAFALWMPVHAASVLDAIRTPTNATSKAAAQDWNVKILLDGAQSRVDVIIDGVQRVSLIDNGDRQILVDHTARVYVERRLSQSAAPRALSWSTTHRDQFALGGYCSVSRAHWSGGDYQERCTLDANYLLGGNAEFPTSVASFLSVVAAERDPNKLFADAQATVRSALFGHSVPVFLRHFEGDRLFSELRVLSVSDEPLPRGAFAVPKHMQRVAADRLVASALDTVPAKATLSSR